MSDGPTMVFLNNHVPYRERIDGSARRSIEKDRRMIAIFRWFLAAVSLGFHLSQAMQLICAW